MSNLYLFYSSAATVKTCKKDSDDFSSCLRLAIQEAWPTFVSGNIIISSLHLCHFHEGRSINKFIHRVVFIRVTIQ